MILHIHPIIFDLFQRLYVLDKQMQQIIHELFEELIDFVVWLTLALKDFVGSQQWRPWMFQFSVSAQSVLGVSWPGY